MHIDEIYIENYGCIEKLHIKPELNEQGHPKPIVLVGKNGSGKTLLLSNIVDSIIEFKRDKYSELQEVSENKFYKIGTQTYIKVGESHSYTRVRYNNGGKKYYYIDCMTQNHTHFKNSIFNSLIHSDLEIDNEKFKENGFYKKAKPSFEKEFDTNILMYFPVHRYYEPAWLNQNIAPSFKKEDNFIEKSNKNVIKTNILNEVESWILDVILDKFLYEQHNQRFSNLFVRNEHGGYTEFTAPIFQDYSGKNTTIQNLINQIISTIYKSKDDNIENARIGISNKDRGRQISILTKFKNGSEIQVAPTFNHLSSGEALLLSIFCALLKDFDSISKNGTNNLDQVKGVAVIDEIDLNLHIDYAKNVLPQLMKLFPNVQFVVTSHSPFFLLGMKETYGNDYQLINLPTGEDIVENDFSEIVSAYRIFTKGFDELHSSLKSLEQKISVTTKPLIVTEGKTDWKHFKRALQYFQEEGEYTDIDVSFFEYEDEIEMGDSHLESLLKNMSKVEQNKKIIGIFDCDEANGKKYAGLDFKKFKNNVFAFSIPKPSYRSTHTGISVELLYKNVDIQKTDADGRRLYLTSEFNERGRLLSDINISVENTDKVKKYIEVDKNKIIDSGVTDGTNNIALSKNSYALNILNKTAPFDSVDFEGFKGVFDKLKIILDIPLT
ncbi:MULTISPECIES: AAA family ATPase [Sphingobacterium]|uniref:AAA family ATPase n=1 Tax=Sphingobacterium populi TaxID=1812824 RepID=A0ABW5UDV9_9SPHI|nr:AAA family ATPase [Sphingobacterium sp. CFCC 11742]